jgi:hypothetical protein
MSRAAVYEILTTDDDVLNAPPFEINNKVFPTYTMRGSRQAPADGWFLILRWEESLDVVGDVQVLTVWAHRPRAAGVDFRQQMAILERCKKLLEDAVHRAGEDGVVMAQAKYKGMGPDSMDEGYDTTSKYAIFEINTKVVV